MLGEDSLTRASNPDVWTACDLYARRCTRSAGRLALREGYQGGLDASRANAQDPLGGEEESVRGNSRPETRSVYMRIQHWFGNWLTIAAVGTTMRGVLCAEAMSRLLG